MDKVAEETLRSLACIVAGGHRLGQFPWLVLADHPFRIREILSAVAGLLLRPRLMLADFSSLHHAVLSAVALLRLRRLGLLRIHLVC